MEASNNLDVNKRNYLLAILIATIIAYALTYIEIWQLVLIPGIIAGIINYKKPRKGIYSGAIAVFLAWIIYTSIAMITKNTYVLVDQFSGEIFGGLGYGWIVLILIYLLGILFGALGGALGSGTMLFIQLRREVERDSIQIS